MKRLSKGTEVTVKHILGETAEPLLKHIGGDRYLILEDAYCAGEYCKGGFFHLRQAREVIPGKKLGNNIKRWPRLRKALHEAGEIPVNIPGGDYPLHYVDEIVIPDYSMSGSHYFVIKKADIGRYLDLLPLDEAGQERAEEVAREKAEAEAEAYRQAHDPQCIARRIGSALWRWPIGGEFQRITLVSEDDTEFSVIYPAWQTDLMESVGCNVPKVLCEAPEETGIKYLSGWTAGRLDPRKHHRIKKVYSAGWGRHSAYLMPNPDLANEIRTSYRWLNMFDRSDNDGIDPAMIASAKNVILESFDLNDRLLKVRYVYSSETEEVTKEYLHNWPFNVFDELNGELDWRAEAPTEDKTA